MIGILLLMILFSFLAVISLTFRIINELKMPDMKILGPFINTESVTIIAALVCICSGGIYFLSHNTTSLNFNLIVILGMSLLVLLGICLIILSKIGKKEILK